MVLLENKMLLVAVGIAVFYLAYRLFSGMSRNERVYRQQMEAVLNSDEYKVKGRFE